MKFHNCHCTTAHFPFQAISFRRGIRWPPRHYCDKRTFLRDLLPSWKWRRIPMQKRVADDLDFLWHTAGRSINDDVIHFLRLAIINIFFHYIIVMKGIPPGFIAFLKMKTYSQKQMSWTFLWPETQLAFFPVGKWSRWYSSSKYNSNFALTLQFIKTMQW